jgi:Mrp family chromosome partitioning ATPase
MKLPSLRKTTVERDELGGSEDGGLAIVTDQGELHITSSRVASALRYLLARRNSLGSNVLPNRLAITSALKGEGVSFIARSLASVLAYDNDESVVIVDLNWRAAQNGGGRRIRRKADQPGRSTPTLADALERETAVDDIIMKTANPRLSLIEAGVLPFSRRPAVAGSKALEDVVDELASRFDYTLFDLPPVLASSDAITLAHLSDAYLLVVRQGVTSERQIETALRELDGMDSIGVVLNRVHSNIPRMLRRMVEN